MKICDHCQTPAACKAHEECLAPEATGPLIAVDLTQLVSLFEIMKHPTGKECKKTDCIRHDSYVRWQCGDNNLNVCMKCKWALPSQFTKKPKAAPQANSQANAGHLAPPTQDSNEETK